MKPKFEIGDTVETPCCMGWVRQIFKCIHDTEKFVYSVTDAEDAHDYLVFENEMKGV